MNKVNNICEWSALKACILHKPGLECTKTNPLELKYFLMEDLMYQPKALQAIEYYAQKLAANGVEVLFIEELIAEVIELKPQLRGALIQQFIDFYKLEGAVKKAYLKLLDPLNAQDLVNRLIAGTGMYELGLADHHSDPTYVTEPLVNLLFQRDASFAIGNCICISKMSFPVRRPETILTKFLFFNHPRFAEVPKITFEEGKTAFIEGGDVMVLKEDHVFIGLSERTNLEAVRMLAKKIFATKGNTITKISAIDMLEKTRRNMHLDTVFTQIDQNAFNLYQPLFAKPINIIVFDKITGENKVTIMFADYLKGIFGPDTKFFEPPADEDIYGNRWEQWNDAMNVMAIGNKTLFSYDCNVRSNNRLRAAGFNVVEVESSTLSSARGGTHCLTMPLCRVVE